MVVLLCIASSVRVEKGKKFLRLADRIERQIEERIGDGRMPDAIGHRSEDTVHEGNLFLGKRLTLPWVRGNQRIGQGQSGDDMGLPEKDFEIGDDRS